MENRIIKLLILGWGIVIFSAMGLISQLVANEFVLWKFLLLLTCFGTMLTLLINKSKQMDNTPKDL